MSDDHTLWPAGQYRKKPVVIEAYRFDNRIWNHPPHWLTLAMSNGEIVHHANHLIINTLEGQMRANFDDWIIKGVAGEIYPCKPDIFAATYEAVENPMTKDELAPCPFCKSTDSFVERADFSGCYVICSGCYVICNVCSARGPVSCDETDEDVAATDSGECEPGERAARRLWNTRATTTGEAK